jgi:hypothetical protein
LVFTRPDDLPDEVLIEALLKGWGLDVASLEYRAVGFGSHHWSARATDGRRWFLTVDDLDAKQRFSNDSREVAFARLRAALSTARSVNDAGADFVAAPLLGRESDVLHRVTDRFALAVYPRIEGRSHPWGEFETVADRLQVLKLIVSLHAASLVIIRDALVDDFLVPTAKS